MASSVPTQPRSAPLRSSVTNEAPGSTSTGGNPIGDPAGPAAPLGSATPVSRALTAAAASRASSAPSASATARVMPVTLRWHGCQLEDERKVGQGRDHRAGPVRIGFEREVPAEIRGGQAYGRHAGQPGAAELVAAAVTDVDAVVRLDPERVAGGQVHRRIGLGRADGDR